MKDLSPTMKIRTKQYCDRQGAMLPLIAVAIVILFVAAVLAIDVARMHVVRSELRTATDAAARAAVESLGRTESEADAIDAALAIARLNPVAGEPLDLDPDQIVFGSAQQNADGTFTFFAEGTGSDPNAIANSVRVLGERTSTSPNGESERSSVDFSVSIISRQLKRQLRLGLTETLHWFSISLDPWAQTIDSRAYSMVCRFSSANSMPPNHAKMFR